jgi:hypothetical protein
MSDSVSVHEPRPLHGSIAHSDFGLNLSLTINGTDLVARKEHA